MYTVIRFRADELNADVVEKIRTDVMSLRPQSTASISKRFPRISFDVVDGGVWADHVAAIQDFVLQFRALIEWAVGIGVVVEFDVAVYAADVGGKRFAVFLHQDAAWMRLLSELGISLEISLYGLGDQSEQVH
jgi:hypothetical protein